MAEGRTGCRDASTVDEVARAAADCPALRLIGVAGYEAALGHDVTARGVGRASPDTSSELRSAVEAVGRRVRNRQRRRDRRWQYLFRRGGRGAGDRVGGRRTVRTIIRSGCYLTHDDGLYARTSPLGRSVVGVCFPRCRCGRKWCRDRNRIWQC